MDDIALPHDENIEAALIGSLLLEPNNIERVSRLLRVSSVFFIPSLRSAYESIVEVFTETGTCSPASVASRLRVKGVPLDLCDCIEMGSPVEAVTMDYSRTVLDRAQRRLALAAFDKAARQVAAYHPLSDTMIDIIQGLSFDDGSGPTKVGGDSAEIDRWAEDGIPRLTTGYDSLDAFNTLPCPSLTLLAARASMGKTSAALNIAQNVARSAGPVIFYSLEMSRVQVEARILCSLAGVNLHDLMVGTLPDDDRDKLNAAKQQLIDLPLWIDDETDLNISSLAANMRMMKQSNDAKLFVIDYLQLVSHDRPGAMARYQELGQVIKIVKAMGKDLGTPVLALCQLSRSPETRKDKRPMLSDLRESGNLEQDADVVMFVHREDYYHRSESDYVKTHEAEFIVAKNRNGPTGVSRLFFDEETLTFQQMEDDVEWEVRDG